MPKLSNILSNQHRISISKSTLQHLYDVSAIIALFALSIYVVYFQTQDFSRLCFLVLIIVFSFSKKDYFWFAYFFILIQRPGFFFAEFSSFSQYRLPLYTFASGMSFTPLDLFVIVAFAKAMLQGKKVTLRLRKPLIFIGGYMIFSLFATSLVFGTDIEILAFNIRWIFYYSLIISFLYLVKRKSDTYRFIFLLSPFVLFVLFTQIYYLMTGTEFINLFSPGFRSTTMDALTGQLRPIMGGVLIVFFSFLSSISLLENSEYKVSRVYLYFIIIISFLSVFLSATRVWFVMFSFILLGYIFVSKRKAISIVGIVSIFLLVVSVFSYLNLIPLDLLFKGPVYRFKQLIDIAGGNIYSVETAHNRFLVQLPILFKVIKENPFIGYGFSEFALIYRSCDLGCINTIILYGFFGFSLFIYFFIEYFLIMKLSIKRLAENNPFKMTLKVMTVAWGGVLIGYFSTWDFFTYEQRKVFFVAVLIAVSELFIRYANNEELTVTRRSCP